MDFSHENTSKSTPELPEDDGRSHFLETLGAGDEALNSLRQLRELSVQSKEGVVLSSQPDEISDSLDESEPSSPMAKVQLTTNRVLTESQSDTEKAEAEAKPKQKGQRISVEVQSVKLGTAPVEDGSSEKASIETPSANEKGARASDGMLADLPLFSDLGKAVETAPLENISLPSEVEEEAPVEMPDDAEAVIAPGTESPEKVEAETFEETSESEAISEDPEVVADAADLSGEVVDEAPASPGSVAPDPEEQITLSCPKCEGELTLMRAHLGIEGNCVWCQIPIVAAASGTNGQVRIFPIQAGTAVFGIPEKSPQLKEEPEEVVEELAIPIEADEESISEELEDLKLDDGAAAIGVVEDEAPTFELEPESLEDTVEASAVEETFPGFEKAENESMPETLESPQAFAEKSDSSIAGPNADLADIGFLPNGFESAMPTAPVDEAPLEMMPSGFAPAEAGPVSQSTPEGFSAPDHQDDPGAAPVELTPDAEVPSEMEGLPAPVMDEVVIPSGFSSMPSPIELDVSSEEEGSVSADESESAIDNEDVAAGFSTPAPWGLSPAPSNEVIEEGAATESIPIDSPPPVESASAGEAVSSPEPWSALPPRPTNQADLTVPDVVDIPESAPAGFVERNDETEAMAMAGFTNSKDLDAAPKELPLFPSAPETAGSNGLSGFDVPSAPQGDSHFGQLEKSEPEDAGMPPAPQSGNEEPAAVPFPSSAEPLSGGELKEENTEKGFGVTLMNVAEEPSANSPFNNSPFASLINKESEAVAEEPTEENAPEEATLPAPVPETTPVNKIPEPEGPRVESKPLGSIAPKKKARKGFIVFMVILVGFVCGGALATFILPVDEYVAVAKAYMEAKFGVESAASLDLSNLPSVINPAVEPVTPPEPTLPDAN